MYREVPEFVVVFTQNIEILTQNVLVLVQNVLVLVQNVLVFANVLTFCNGSPISSRVVTLRHDISELRWSYTTNLGSKLSRNIILFICNQPEASRRHTEREIPNVTVLVPE